MKTKLCEHTGIAVLVCVFMGSVVDVPINVTAGSEA